jgi:hypothetical protein
MGRQFSFFLGPEDRAPFEEVLRSDGATAFFNDRPLEPCVVELNGLSPTDFRTLLARKTDLEGIAFHPVKTQKFFATDCVTQYLIECDAPFEPRNGYLLEGRLYLQATYWNEQNEKVTKSEHFLKWAESLFRRTKKSLTRVDPWAYAGRHALRLREEGIKFNQLDGWAT